MLDSAIADTGSTSWDRRITQTFAAGSYVVRIYEMPAERKHLVTFERVSHPQWRKWKISRDDTYIAETFWRWKLHARVLNRLRPILDWLRPLGWRW